jgi:hypothetical protein
VLNFRRCPAIALIWPRTPEVEAHGQCGQESPTRSMKRFQSPGTA